MKNNQATFNEIQKTLGLGPNPPPEAVTKLVRAIHDIVSTPDGASALAALKSQVEQARLEREEVKKALMSSGKSAGEADASIKIATQEGQLKHYEKQLLASGQGKGERPCWVKPDGKIEYLYDVKLASDGIHLREYVHSTRVADRARLPMPQVEPSEALDPEEFLRRTRPLFDAGIAENCRFFVVVYDGTAPYEKPLYKQLLRTVEGHFYKRLDQRDAPF